MASFIFLYLLNGSRFSVGTKYSSHCPMGKAERCRLCGETSSLIIDFGCLFPEPSMTLSILVCKNYVILGVDSVQNVPLCDRFYTI